MLHKLLRLASTRYDRERALSVLEPRVVCCLESPFLKRRVDQLHALDWCKSVQSRGIVRVIQTTARSTHAREELSPETVPPELPIFLSFSRRVLFIFDILAAIRHIISQNVASEHDSTNLCS